MSDKSKLNHPSLQRLWWSSAIRGESVLVVIDEIMKQVEDRYSFLDDTYASELKDIWIEDLTLQWKAVEQWRQVFRRFMLLSLVFSLIASVTLVTPFSGVFGVVTLPFYFCAAHAALNIYERLQFLLSFSNEVVSKLDDLSKSVKGQKPIPIKPPGLSGSSNLSFPLSG